MTPINWLEEVEKRKDDLIKTTQAFLRIKSVMDMQTAGEGKPFGEGIAQALEFALHVCSTAGMTTKNVAGLAGHAEFGQGAELVGVLSHVDVVPEGDGWTTPPYAAEVVDGKIVARGAIDDKGPAMASIFAAKLVKELGLPLGKRVRLIFGTDEETNWRCVRTYFETEEMPTIGFTPDADFPLIYAEKGVTHLVFRQTQEAYEALPSGIETGAVGSASARLVRLQAGLRMNMVPDRAEAVLEVADGRAEEIATTYRVYLAEGGRLGEAKVEGNRLTLTFEGVSVHGMDPGKGVNAGTELVRFLTGLKVDERAAQFVTFTDTFLYHQHTGEAFGIAHEDAEMGLLTLNTGVINYEATGDAVFHINIRYPHSLPYEKWEAVLLSHLEPAGYVLEVEDHLVPHRVDPTHPLVTILQKVYTEQTGDEAKIMAIGGATYGRSLNVGVAFGPLFPGRVDCAHQRDEHIFIDDLVRATAIYAQAIYELAQA